MHLAASVPAADARFVSSASASVNTHVTFDSALARAHPQTTILSVAYSDRIEPAALDALPDLRAIITRSDGYDHLPAADMKARGIAGYHLGDYATDSVAEFACGAIIALLHRAPEAAARTRAGAWSRVGLESRRLADVTVGVLGAGCIGGALARRLAAWGTRVRAFDVARNVELSNLPGFAFVDTLDALLEVSDVLTIHVPLNATTRGMLGGSELGRLPSGAVLVNTARGDIVDQYAVLDALRSGHLAGYAADVLPGEPFPPDLVAFEPHSNVLLTPHMAAFDLATLQERYARTGRIVAELLAGRAATEFRCV